MCVNLISIYELIRIMFVAVEGTQTFLNHEKELQPIAVSSTDNSGE